MFRKEELFKRRNTIDSCLFVVDQDVYDVTKFVSLHPGGSKLLLDTPWEEMSTRFLAVHGREMLGKHSEVVIHVGTIDTEAPLAQLAKDKPISMQEELKGGTGAGTFVVDRLDGQALAKRVLNLKDIEQEARKRLAPSFFQYIFHGSEDEESLTQNLDVWNRFALRPRVLKDVSRPDTGLRIEFKLKRDTSNTTISMELDSPICIAPFAAGRLAHEEGEKMLAKFSSQVNSLYIIPHYASFPLEAIVEGNKCQWFQMYAPASKETGKINKEYVCKVLDYVATLKSIKAIVLTIDSPVFGNREATYRNFEWVKALKQECGGLPVPRALEQIAVGNHGGNTRKLDWDDMAWFLNECQTRNLAFLMKGIMTHEDALLAAQAGIHGIVVSNHGGRQLDGTLGCGQVAFEVTQALGQQFPDFHVFVDGGIRRGKDVFKALAMGCKGVLVGRPFLYGLGIAGQDGVDKVYSILKDELINVMQLTGCSQIADISSSHIHCML